MAQDGTQGNIESGYFETARYYRYLGELIEEEVERISSNELSNGRRLQLLRSARI